MSTKAALEHPHAMARGMVVDVPRPDGSSQQQVGTPIKLSNYEPVYAHVGPELGSHTTQVLTEIGYDTAAIDGLAICGRGVGLIATHHFFLLMGGT